MMYFCTLFDSNYISKGIALYLSIAKYTDDFVLYIMAMDRKCEEMLCKLNFAHVEVECIEDNMSSELEKAKSNRSRAEYCWTCGSYITDLFLHKYNLPEITYLDSDLMFFNCPQIIQDELREKNASVGLSPHFIHDTTFGKYCVQYVYFKNDKNGVEALRWWRNECLKWCYSKLEKGKYGDQKYLDYMPQMFDGVVDIENRGAGIARWNEMFYNFSENALTFKGELYPYIFFHYSGFNIKKDNKILSVIQNYYVSYDVMNYLVLPYVNLLRIVYSKYLEIEIDEISFRKSFGHFKGFLLFIKYNITRYKLGDAINRIVYLINYSKRYQPYSVRDQK